MSNPVSTPITNNNIILNVANSNVITVNPNNNNNAPILIPSNLPKTVMQSNAKLNQVTASNPSTIQVMTSQPTTPSGPQVLGQPSQSVPSSSAPNNANTSGSYGGFAHCSNCGDYGVKAAFYGKSKLYCTVACQNGIKKQQQQTQGTKRTIDSLNYSSPVSSSSSSIIINPSLTLIPTNVPTTSSNQTNIISTDPNQSSVSNSSKIEVFPSTLNNPGNNQLSTSPKNLKTLNQTTENPQKSQTLLLNTPANVKVENISVPQTSVNVQNGNPSKRARNNSGSSVSSNSSVQLINTQSNLISNQSTLVERVESSVEPISLSPQIKFQWSSYLDKKKEEAAPVYFFKHVPLSGFWSKIVSNLVVEVPNKEDSIDENQKVYWFAKVVKFAGYLVKLRYFGYEEDDSNDFWYHMCDSYIHHVGWSSDNDITLSPPNALIDLKEDWKGFLIEKLIGFQTLPADFGEKVNISLKSSFKIGMLLELVDKKRISSMRIARIMENNGRRLRMKYESTNSDEIEDFWCHELSDLIHPIGWAATVGHHINAPEEYIRRSAMKLEKNIYELNECSPSIFKKKSNIMSSKNFKPGMKLEAIDPLNLSTICVATVGKVLKNNYLMIRIDGYQVADDSDMFCYHCTSSSIYPAGFCQKNSIQLQEPYGYRSAQKFSWKTYLSETNSEFAPSELFDKDASLVNPFKVGMKIESVDLIEPKMVCVATIIAVVDRLLRLHFDGWETEYDQWIDYESCDIYPVGWCELVKFPLEPPLTKEQSSKKKPKENVKRKYSSR